MMKIERHQPDCHELNDWALYGSKDPEIAWLVDRLALDRGLRVREIKALTLQALKDRTALEEARQQP